MLIEFALTIGHADNVLSPPLACFCHLANDSEDPFFGFPLFFWHEVVLKEFAILALGQNCNLKFIRVQPLINSIKFFVTVNSSRFEIRVAFKGLSHYHCLLFFQFQCIWLINVSSQDKSAMCSLMSVLRTMGHPTDGHSD